MSDGSFDFDVIVIGAGYGGFDAAKHAAEHGLRTAIIETDMLELHQRPDPTSPVVAQAELGVIAFLDECNGTWCRLNVAGHRGWVPMGTLWGVDPGESFD